MNLKGLATLLCQIKQNKKAKIREIKRFFPEARAWPSKIVIKTNSF